jgi:hypothetical protein
MMDAAPILSQIAELLERYGLEAILVGNAGVIPQVSFLRTPANLAKLKKIARELRAGIYRSFYPTTATFRVSRESDDLKLDFMAMVGVGSFEALRGRAQRVQCGESGLLVVASQPLLPKPRTTRKQRLALLKKESEQADLEMIRRWQALPPERRTNFLRKRIGLRASCL